MKKDRVEDHFPAFLRHWVYGARANIVVDQSVLGGQDRYKKLCSPCMAFWDLQEDSFTGKINLFLLVMFFFFFFCTLTIGTVKSGTPCSCGCRGALKLTLSTGDVVVISSTAYTLSRLTRYTFQAGLTLALGSFCFSFRPVAEITYDS